MGDDGMDGDPGFNGDPGETGLPVSPTHTACMPTCILIHSADISTCRVLMVLTVTMV